MLTLLPLPKPMQALDAGTDSGANIDAGAGANVDTGAADAGADIKADGTINPGS